ncbi:hypothetical protein [Nocardioides convexus]|uniref:hypothetical protein n=1 Tax=Nocardioides convexus TaxID=2712224 RepID=UPI0024184E7E|nr:hypothetical protein [Nocardioides convexus]
MPRRRGASRRSPFGSRLLGPRDQSPRGLRIRIQVLLTVLLLSTNVIGVVLVFAINIWVIPSPPPTHGMVLALAIAVPVYVAAAVVVGTVWGTTRLTGRAALGDRPHDRPGPHPARAWAAGADGAHLRAGSRCGPPGRSCSRCSR